MDLKKADSPYRAFSVAAFRSLLLGNTLVHIGASAQSLAIGWEMYQRTDQALYLGLIGLTLAVPMLLFTLPAGYLADAYDRRKVMMAGMIGTTLTSVALAVFSITRGSIGWMFALLFLDASFHRLANPAWSAILPVIVPKEMFENAVKWRTTAFQLSAVLGPGRGGCHHNTKRARCLHFQRSHHHHLHASSVRDEDPRIDTYTQGQGLEPDR